MVVASLYLLPPPALADPSDALDWLASDGLALFAAVGAGLQHAQAGTAAAIFDVLLTDTAELAGYALRVARGEPVKAPALALEPTPEASFLWATRRMEDALGTLALRPALSERARRGIAILAAALSARLHADTDAERAALVLPRHHAGTQEEPSHVSTAIDL